MPGADLSIDVAPRERMGVRRPRHTYHGQNVLSQNLKPWLAAPLRPGEILEGPIGATRSARDLPYHFSGSLPLIKSARTPGVLVRIKRRASESSPSRAT